MPDGSLALVRDLDAFGMTLETDCEMFPGQQLQFELCPKGTRVAFTATGLVEAVEVARSRSCARVRFTRLRMHART